MHALLLFMLPALAFRADPDITIGTEPTRIRLYHKDPQAALRHGAAWTDFVNGEGAGWVARFDERTGTPHRAWGPGIPLGPLPDQAAVEAALRGFFARNPALLGIDPANLRLEKAGYVARTDTWYVRFGQVVQGTDVGVWRGGVEARVRFGKLILLGVDTYPDADAVQTSAAIGRDRAIDLAQALGPAPLAPHEIQGARLVVLPLDDRHSLEHHLAWEVRTRTESPVGIWVAHVDAQTGDLLNVYNEVRFISGTLSGTHDDRTVNGDFVTSDVLFAPIEGDDDSSTYTDDNGAWSLDGASSATSNFHGEKVCVVNDGRGGNGELSLTGDATWTDDDATQAEIDSYIFLHDVIAWNEEYAPEVSVLSEDSRNACRDTSVIVSLVNQNSTCNAYFDGNVNFFTEGGGCNNTGRIADVNYHEWGHGFHYYNMESGVYDGSISEGIGDSVSFMQTGDPIIAPYFMTTGEGIREVDSDRVYPDDWVGEVHEDGLIFAGAVWDLWAALDLQYPDDPGQAYDTLSQLFVDGLKSGPEIPDSYDEFVAADDDNGDLSDGTPHQCAIIDAFGYHGLGPGADGGVVSMDHTPLDNQLADGADYPLDAELTNLAPTCADFSAEDSTLYYSTDGGDSWSAVALDTDGDSAIFGSIPAQPEGTIVQYYIEVGASDGSTVYAPTGGSINPYTFFVGELTEIYCADFEDEDFGFTHELLDGRDELGADDWMWGKPRGSGGDPDYAYSGDKVWGNDLGGGNYNGEYQESKWNRLSSPSVDVTGYKRVVLQYRRWLGVEDGFYDQATIGVNGVTVWSNHATSSSIGDEHTVDDQWMLHTLDVPLDGTGLAVFNWDITSDGGLNFGGWNLDDVCVYGASAAVVDTGDTADTGDTGGGDSGTDSGGDTGTPDTGPGGDDLVLKTGDCGCATSSEPGQRGALGALLGLGLLLVRRRRA